MLGWVAVHVGTPFVDEQFEEVRTMSELLQVVKRAGEGNLLLVEEFLAREPSFSDPHGGEDE